MQLNLLKPGAMVAARMMITPDKARNWKHARTNAAIGGGLVTGAKLKVVQVSSNPSFARLELPGRSPPAFITVTGEELAMNFDMAGGAQPAAAVQGPKNLGAIFQKLSQRQMAVSGGLEALRTARAELKQDIATGQFWGGVAVFANAMLMPLNVIINASGAKGVTTVYQAVVKEVYAKVAKSGTRIDNNKVKTSLALIKKATVEALTAKGLKQHIPGVNIIVGVAEDGFALIETARTVQDGSKEMRDLLRQMDAKIDASYNSYIKIGIEMNRLLTEMQTRARTA